MDAPGLKELGPDGQELLALLMSPAPKSQEWQEAASRCVAKVATRFIEEADDSAALRIVAAMTLAQQAGVKEARKRELKLARWAGAAPPSLQALAGGDLRRAALEALSRIKADWALPYILGELSQGLCSEAEAAALVKWAKLVAPAPTVFVARFCVPALSKALDGGQLHVILKESARELRPVGWCAPKAFAGWFGQLVSAVAVRLRQCPEEKLAPQFGSLLLSMALTYVVRAPSLLFDVEFLANLRLLRELPSAFTEKLWASGVEPLSATLSALLQFELERHGAEAIREWRPLWDTWIGVLPNMAAYIESAAAEAPQLRVLVTNPDGGVPADVAEHSRFAEGLFARLLPSWRAFCDEHPERDVLASLNGMILEAAALSGVEFDGARGQRCSFDPLSHHSVNGLDRSTEVEILQPAVVSRRSDGSVRVLVPALVKPV